MCDNSKDDKHFYLITVKTGLRQGAGTRSIANFVLYGETGDSGVRVLSDDLKKVTNRSVIEFVRQNFINSYKKET